MINICFMGNPKFAIRTLDVLYNDENINLKLVVSSKDKKRSRNKFMPTEVKKYAEDKGIRVMTPDKVSTDEFLDILMKEEIDFIVVVAFGQLIKAPLLDYYENRIINLHPSLLPKYRGAAPIQFALLNGDKKTAASAMLIEKGMDSGDILIQKELEIADDDDYNSLEEKLSELGAYLIRDSILSYDELFKSRIKQDDDKATYCTKITKDMGKIDWNRTSKEILDQIRSLVSYPVAYFSYKGENVKIYKASLVEGKKAKAGQILQANKKDKIVITTGDSAIRIEKIQFPGKKVMDTQSFLLGNDIEVGMILTDE